MVRRLLLPVVVVLVAASVASVASAREGAKVLSITSDIDGKTVLPQRSRWLAYPSVPAAQVAEVDFLIDGKLRWGRALRAVQLRK